MTVVPRPSLLGLSLTVLLSACAVHRAASPLDVPFYPQHREGHCGATALRMVLTYHGLPADDGEIVEQVHLPALKGTIPELLAEAATGAGLEARVVRGDVARLESWLRQGLPPIILLSASAETSRGHFVVVTGIDADRSWIRLHTGTRRNHWMSTQEFEERWKNGRFLALLAAPKKNPRRLDITGTMNYH